MYIGKHFLKTCAQGTIETQCCSYPVTLEMSCPHSNSHIIKAPQTSIHNMNMSSLNGCLRPIYCDVFLWICWPCMKTRNLVASQAQALKPSFILWSRYLRLAPLFTGTICAGMTISLGGGFLAAQSFLMHLHACKLHSSARAQAHVMRAVQQCQAIGETHLSLIRVFPVARSGSFSTKCWGPGRRGR